MDIKAGSVVRSTAGHDKGDLHIVLAIDGSYALLVDGKGRRAEKPKRKNLRHIAVVMQEAEGISKKISDGEKILSSEIRKTLSHIAAAMNK